jgi:hypothetical protein
MDTELSLKVLLLLYIMSLVPYDYLYRRTDVLCIHDHAFVTKILLKPNTQDFASLIELRLEFRHKSAA